MANNDGKHSKNDPKLPNRILYRARRRTSVYNDFIPLSEQQKTSDSKIKETLANAANGIKSKFAGIFSERKSRPAKPREITTRAERYERAAVAARSSAQHSRTLLTVGIICAVIVGCSFIFIPLAFAEETHSVTLYDGGREYSAETAAATVGEFLDHNGITVGQEDYLETPAETEITDDMNIIIRRAMDLTIKNGTDTTSVTMVAGTVEDALTLAGINIEDGDEIYPSEDSYVRSGMKIDYINVDIEYVTETKTIGFQEKTVYTDKLYEGEQKITQYGEEGSKEVTYKQVYKNGTLYSSEVEEETITKEPVSEIVSIGTKVYKEPEKEKPSKPSKPSGGSKPSGSSKPNFVSTEGAPAEIQGQIKYAVKSEVTAFCSHCDPSGVGASGSALTWGSLAADTSTFPFGTKIYIPGYGIGYVVDRGSAINGTDIDIYMGSQSDESTCNAWGRRTVTIYVLN